MAGSTDLLSPPKLCSCRHRFPRPRPTLQRSRPNRCACVVVVPIAEDVKVHMLELAMLILGCGWTQVRFVDGYALGGLGLGFAEWC